MWVLLLGGLSALAWVSTYTGIMELIIASSGEVGWVPRVAVAFAVFMLQLMILYVLDAMFSGQLRWWLWPMYIIGYFILFLISVGFAFGFYWKYLEAGSTTTSSAENSLREVQQTLQLGTTRLEQLQTTFASLAVISAQKSETERTVGRTCAGSPPGDGPRRRLREADAQRFQFADQYISQRVPEVKTDITAVNEELQKILQHDPSTFDPVTGSRTAFISGLNRQLGLVSTRFNALRSDPQLLQLRDELRNRAGQTSFPDERGGSFSCPDGQLQTALNGVVRAINELPPLNPPLLRSFEGSEAVIEAFRRLTNSGITSWRESVAGIQNGFAALGVGNPAAPVPPTVGGLLERDYISLIIAIFVDLCILLVSINRPFGPFFELSRSMESARGGGMNEYLETFYKVFQDQFDPAKRPTAADVIAPIQDVVFDYKGRYYAAVPLDFREEDYHEWLRKRTGPTAAEAIFQATSEKPLEVSRYITSVFATLEGSNFVKLIEGADEGLSPGLIKQKLDQQGSVYAQADAFRIYRFRDKAWAQILMQSVGSSAAMSEKLAKRKTKEGNWEKPRIQIPGTEGTYRGEARSVDAGSGQRAVTEDVSSRLAVEDQREGIDEDPDTDDYGAPKVNSTPRRDTEPSGGGSPSGKREEPVGMLGVFTKLRNYLHRK
ncbi:MULTISPECIES: hypothetical protein [Rhodomicrobium]|uniref:hypothetical protein n=1 Tax=Rhodomicrobium TaxID=1068 RepID=UPI000B4C112A|nr:MULTISPECIES: hypothetical protein [Rhodomicrobium]